MTLFERDALLTSLQATCARVSADPDRDITGTALAVGGCHGAAVCLAHGVRGTGDTRPEAVEAWIAGARDVIGRVG